MCAIVWVGVGVASGGQGESGRISVLNLPSICRKL